MKKENIKLKDGTSFTLPCPECLNDSIELIQSDLYRGTGIVYSKITIFFRALFHPLRSTMIWFRLCQVKSFIYPFARVLYKISSKMNHIDIPIATRIGYGFYIGHGMCMVINGKTVIGNNVNLSQFLNIGTNKGTPAIISDNVYIAPMVCIVEDVQISKGATVGAGAVVVKDISENSVAVGVPAKTIHQRKREPWFYWPLD